MAAGDEVYDIFKFLDAYILFQTTQRVKSILPSRQAHLTKQYFGPYILWPGLEYLQADLSLQNEL